ncbi:MAG: hypothetical protein VW268_11315 [Rhodospirillaceae bacterium]
MTRFLIPAFLFLLCAASARADVVDVKTRDTQIRILIEGPDKPSHVVTIFAGGHGAVGIDNAGEIGKMRGNFAVRTRAMLQAHGMATVVLAAPDDMSSLKDRRNTDEYATDVESVMAYLRGRFPGTPIWMHGTSRSTISITMTVPKFKSAANRPDGIVLSASVTEPTNSGGEHVMKAKLGAITGAVLVAHHKDDPCYVTPPAGAERLLNALTAAKPKKLMMLEGGGQNARGGDCGAKAQHGFVDMEQEAIDAMAGWIKSVK